MLAWNAVHAHVKNIIENGGTALQYLDLEKKWSYLLCGKPNRKFINRILSPIIITVETFNVQGMQ
jgi:hypothetical protein